VQQANWALAKTLARCLGGEVVGAGLNLALTECTSRLWRQGIADNHQLPFTYRGKPLSLKSIRDRTSIKLLGFYGGQDRVVPEATARPLKQTLKERYPHVVYPKAGHIAFVLTPASWNPRSKKAFAPNPAELMIQAYEQAD
jgi:pimeloyl-ACP methyl ester carboxylesterase